MVLINFSDEPVENLAVRFPGKTQIQCVRSLRKAGYFKGHLHEQEKGALEIRHINSVPEVKLDLGVSDYLLTDLKSCVP